MSSVTLPSIGGFKSLDAVTATGAGGSCAVASSLSTFGMQVTATGAPDACIVNLEGTIDGTHWITLVAWTSLTSGAIVWVAAKPVCAVRANLATLTNGTAPTVTATLVTG